MCPDACKCHASRNGSFKGFPDPDITYVLNNYCYRSDDFSVEDAKNNFLFSGCSYTFGTGIPYSGTWAYQFNKFFKKEKFMNLAINGASSDIIIKDIYRYVENFGKPLGVFVIFPDLGRETIIKDTTKYLSLGMKTIEETDFEFFDFIHSVKNLESYLTSLGIPFLWGTWRPDLEDETAKIAPGFINSFIRLLNHPNGSDFLEAANKAKTKKYWLKARDNHPGIQKQTFYYEAFKYEWLKRF